MCRDRGSSSSCSRAIWWSRTTRRRCPPACTASMSRAARRSKCGSRSGFARDRSRASAGCEANAPAQRSEIPRCRLRRGRLPHADRRPAAAAVACARRSSVASGGPFAATVEGLFDHPASGPAAVRRLDWTPSGPALRVTAGRSSTRTCPRRSQLWDVWTPIAGRAGRLRAAVGELRAGLGIASVRCAHRGIAFATITLAAGISSTGDPELDRRLPFDEPYRISEATARAIRRTRANGGRDRRDRDNGRARTRARRSGTTGSCTPVTASRISAWARRAGCELSMPFSRAPMSPAAATTSCCARSWMTPRWPRPARRSKRLGYRTHEFGDSVLIERSNRMVRDAAGCGDRRDTCATAA